MHHIAQVDDALLRKLSSETQLVGKPVLIKGGPEEQETSAVIINVIILPFSGFYRRQFMSCYEHCQRNAVKALKELAQNFPNADYGLDIGYSVSSGPEQGAGAPDSIKHRDDFMLMDDLATHRQDLLRNRLKVISGPSASK